MPLPDEEEDPQPASTRARARTAISSATGRSFSDSSSRQTLARAPVARARGLELGGVRRLAEQETPGELPGGGGDHHVLRCHVGVAEAPLQGTARIDRAPSSRRDTSPWRRGPPSPSRGSRQVAAPASARPRGPPPLGGTPGELDLLERQSPGGAQGGLGPGQLGLDGRALRQRPGAGGGAFPPASAMRSSIAPRAMPRATAAIPRASSPNRGKA